MMPSLWTVRTLIATAMVVAGIGIAGGIEAGSWDLVAVFVALLVIQGCALARSSRRRHHVRLRADLASQLTDVAVEGDETLESVVDRALASFLSSSEPTCPSTPWEGPPSGSWAGSWR